MKAFSICIIIVNLLVILSSIVSIGTRPIGGIIINIVLNLASIIMWVSIYRRLNQ